MLGYSRSTKMVIDSNPATNKKKYGNKDLGQRAKCHDVKVNRYAHHVKYLELVFFRKQELNLTAN